MKMRGRKIPGLIWGGLATALASFLTLAEALNPFPMALAAAAMCAGMHMGGILAAVMVGAAMSGQYSLAAGGMAVAAVKWLARKWPPEVRAALAAGSGALAAGAILQPGWMALAASVILAVALSPALIDGFSLHLGRNALTPEEKLSAAVITALMLAGCARIHPAARPLGQAAAAALTLLAAREGAAQGALAGLAAGAACLHSPALAVSMGIGGAAAGACRAWPAPVSAAAMLAAAALTEYALHAVSAEILICVAAGGALGCLTPQRARKQVEIFFAAPGNFSAERKLIQARQSVKYMSEALNECARACHAGGESEGGNASPSVMREKLCEGCADYARCWSGQSGEASRLFSLLSARSDGETAEELPPDQVRFCRRAAHISRKLNGVLSAARERQSRQREQAMAARMCAAPMERVAILLEGLEQELSGGEEDVYAAECALGALDQAGRRVTGVSVSKGPGQAVQVMGEDAQWSGEQLRRVAGLFSQALGGQYSARGGGRFVQEAQVRVMAGIRSREASPGAPCGDQAACVSLGDGRTALILSDGMGQGAGAADESRCVLTMIHRLLLAGAQPMAAIDAVNSMMRLRNGEKYATLDLCIVDACRQEAAFYKLGACLSVLMRREMCMRVEGGRLPPGVVEPAEPSVTRMRVRPGDVIIMVSDGVADFARAGQEEWLTTLLVTLRGQSPDDMARHIVEAALARETGRARDDITAVCAKIMARSSGHTACEPKT